MNGVVLNGEIFVKKSADNSDGTGDAGKPANVNDGATAAGASGGSGAGSPGSVANSGSGAGNVTANQHENEYEQGLTNATDEDINKIANGSKIDIIDTSDVDDFTDANIEKFDVTNKIITVKSTSGITIKYKYLETNNYGEKIFVSNKSQQHYVLQKTSDGKFKLMQYHWHSGHKSPDVTEENKDNDNGFEKK